MTNPERSDLTVRDTDKYKAEVELTLKKVFGHYLEKELTAQGRKVLSDERKVYTEKRLPVYFDALDRGAVTLDTALEKGPVEIEVFEGQGIRIYELGTEGLVWELVPATDDILEKAGFFKKLRDFSIPQKGQGDIWTEPLLVNWMLLEGFRQHDRTYANFQNARSLMFSALGYRDVLAYLTMHQLYFSDIERVNSALGKTAGRQPEEKNLFIENFVVPQDPVLNILDKMPELESLGRGISIIHNLLKKEDGTTLPVDHHRRQEYENSLVIELLTNPRFLDLDYKDRFRGRINTTLERVKMVNDFIRKATAGLSPEDAKVTKGLIVYQFIQAHHEKLSAVFAQENIPAELGMEYIQRLLIARLSKLPDPENEAVLRSRYILYYRPQETPRPSPRRDENMFIDGLLKNNIFYTKIFPALSEAKQKESLNEVLRLAGLKKDNTYRQIVRKLLDVFDLSYDAAGYKFMPRANLREKPAEEWKADARRLFLEVCVSRLIGGDLELEDALDRIIQEDAFSGFLRSPDNPLTPRQFGQRVSSAKIDMVTGRQTENETFDRLVDLTARFAVIDFFAKPVPLNYDIRHEVPFYLDIVKKYMVSKKERILFKTPEDDSKFYGAVLNKAREIIAAFQKSYFPSEYPQNKFPFLVKIIEASLAV